MKLKEMILDSHVAIDVIEQYLDGLSHQERLSNLATLDRKEQRRLYQKAAESPLITLGHFVPPSLPARVAVNHHGRNTLPLPAKHRHFQKRFCRPAEDPNRLFGYNEAPSRWIVGPGYFVVVSTEGHPKWQQRGGVAIDYFQVPDKPVCDSWPKVIPNTKGIQRFVYQGTRDFMRRVSEHVSIGAAFKGDESLDHYFVLCRED